MAVLRIASSSDSKNKQSYGNLTALFMLCSSACFIFRIVSVGWLQSEAIGEAGSVSRTTFIRIKQWGYIRIRREHVLVSCCIVRVMRAAGPRQRVFVFQTTKRVPCTSQARYCAHIFRFGVSSSPRVHCRMDTTKLIGTVEDILFAWTM